MPKYRYRNVVAVVFVLPERVLLPLAQYGCATQVADLIEDLAGIAARHVFRNVVAGRYRLWKRII